MATRRLEGRSVLIVDDDEDILNSFELAIRSEGAMTSTATDGHAAIVVCRSAQPDVVVLDMMLPKRSGFLVLEKILELDEPPVVVMVTANQGKRHMEYAETLGVHAYLTKPLSLERLIETVVQLCELVDGEEDES
ncbi:MAG: response regulator [Planctomycetota bacterium]|jgi:CheY-like chemotaxis protein